MKIAIVHDWLVELGGAELVLKEILHCFPNADIFSLIDFLSKEDREKYIKGKKVKTSFLQSFPRAKKWYRNLLVAMPYAVEQFDMREYDLIISSSYAVAKGVITGPDQTHVCYCHSPIRYAWDMQHQYLEESNLSKGVKSSLVKYVLHKIRIWDVTSSFYVDHFLSNSEFISRRIKKVYRRESNVIYPPVDVDSFSLCIEKDDFYLTASRMVPYKKIDLIVRAFSQMPEKKLIVIGTGPDFKKIEKEAGPNIQLMGYQKFSVLKEKMQKAKAFLFAAKEDFGIVPLEAQSCGTPVIAFGEGGALETVQDEITGVFFDKQEVRSIVRAVNRFEELTFDAYKVREHAEEFSSKRFREQFVSFIDSVCNT